MTITITSGKTSAEFEGIGYFESSDELYMSMLPGKQTVDELESLVRGNSSITIDKETFTGYNDLDAITFTYHTRIESKSDATALNIQVKRSK